MASLILYPGLADPETGYIRVMIAYLPASLRGLMIAAFAAAYMSTIATQLNWGASYLVNDFYRRFLRKTESDRHYVNASQMATVLLTIISAVVTFYLDSIAGAWKLLLVTGAGTGGVLLLRWYWWRINAWSEVSAMISGFVVSLIMQTTFGLDKDQPRDFAWIMIITVSITTVIWLAVTFLTRPESKETLVAFYRRTHPSAAGWRPIAKLAPDVKPSTGGLSNLLDWICGCVLIYGILFGTGKLILKDFTSWHAAVRDRPRGRRGDLLGSVAPRLEYSGGVGREILSASSCLHSCARWPPISRSPLCIPCSRPATTVRPKPPMRISFPAKPSTSVARSRAIAKWISPTIMASRTSRSTTISKCRDKAARLLQPVQDGKIETTVTQEDKQWMPKLRETIIIPSLAGTGEYFVTVNLSDELAKMDFDSRSVFHVKGRDVAPSDTLVVRNFRFLRSEDQRQRAPGGRVPPGRCGLGKV